MTTSRLRQREPLTEAPQTDAGKRLLDYILSGFVDDDDPAALVVAVERAAGAWGKLRGLDVARAARPEPAALREALKSALGAPTLDALLAADPIPVAEIADAILADPGFRAALPALLDELDRLTRIEEAAQAWAEHAERCACKNSAAAALREAGSKEGVK